MKWKVKLIWEGDKCYFGDWWKIFSAKCKVEPGDTLILFRCPTLGNRNVNAVIFKRWIELVRSSGGT